MDEAQDVELRELLELLGLYVVRAHRAEQLAEERRCQCSPVPPPSPDWSAGNDITLCANSTPPAVTFA